MATSPDHLRLAIGSTRALGDTALDNLRDAVVVVDARYEHLPVVLANATARRYLGAADAVPLVESPLHCWLTAASATTIDPLLAEPRAHTRCVLAWRFVEGEAPVMTDIRPLASAPEQRLVMLTFAPAVSDADPMVATKNPPFDLLILDIDLKVTYANAAAMRSGASVPGGLLGVSALLLTPTCALPRDVYTRALQGYPFHGDAVEVASLSLPTRCFEVDIRPLRGAGEIVGLVVLSVEVTERRPRKDSSSSGKRRSPPLTEPARDSEVRLRRSEKLLRAAAANTADTLVLLDTALRVRFINKNVGGKSVKQIIGREIGVLLPRAARESVLHTLRQLLVTGETVTYEFESTEGDQVLYFENRAVLVRDDEGGAGISIATRDITERKRLEQEVLDVSGRERQSIGRDLHDGLGQELTGVGLMLRGVASRVQERCPEVVDLVNEIVGLVNRSIENTRSLARGLLPVRTETGGLASALRELASRSRDLYGLEVNFRAKVRPELNLDETQASHLYRIAQEALTNSARHGHATQVDIFLRATATTLLLRISDDGEGIRAPKSPYSGMGLKIMKYRAGMIGAKLEIVPNEPRGTVVLVTGGQSLTAAN